MASTPVHGAAAEPADSSTVGEIFWLPLPVEEIETPDELDDAGVGSAGFAARATVRDGVVRMRRFAATREGRSLHTGVSFLGGVAEREAFTIAVRAPQSRLDVILGRVAVRAAGMPIAEAVGFSRRASRVPVASAAIPALEAPGGESTPSVVGFGLRREPAPGNFHPGGWMFLGRRSDDQAPIGAIGLGAHPGWGSWSVAFGARPGVTASSVGMELRSGPSNLATEVVVARGATTALVSVESGGEAIRIRGRWRFRSADPRPAACELTADAGSRRLRGRIRVSEGLSGAIGTIGRVEFEGRVAPFGAEPLLFRAGWTRTEGFSTEEGATLRRERYGVVDATVARSEGRRLAILATRRRRDLGGMERDGSSVGARLDMTWRRRGSLQLFIEATRVDASGGSAWENGLYAGGSTALRTRTRPGVGASARGAVGVGRWRAGGILEGREDALGRRATAATIWIQRVLQRG